MEFEGRERSDVESGGGLYSLHLQAAVVVLLILVHVGEATVSGQIHTRELVVLRDPEEFQLPKDVEEWAHRSRYPPDNHQDLDHVGRQQSPPTSHKQPVRPARPPRVNLVHITPHAPHPPCSCAASSGSSYPTRSASRLHPIRTSAATNPQITAAHGSTTEHPAVMAAKPPRSPLQTSVTFQCPDRIRFTKRVVSAAVQPASVVVTAVRPTADHCP
ncbi:P-loop containing nucleoside triphosphatehydrolases superfamily protein [Striga asiatica]|uniref:P-loop containing nucleoside triphosphatehydrolases superfamily protein n=1 Tax=Striga asiatica TaxID=4170 RepID=A0A5A7RFD9_STRAF|nr:P-loop containing nucleoside triphosphatehydrolases superfamily protein [Striga asiatica]